VNAAEETLKKLVVIVPAYNEQEKITETINRLKAVGDDVRKAGFELLIYVIDDGSTDKTASLAEQAGADRVIRHKVNIGLGAAVRSGLTAAKKDSADIAVKFDADLQHEPADIMLLIEPIVNEETDIVYGNRFERIEYNMPMVRKTGNKVFTKLMSVMTGWPVKDSQPGIFAANKDYLAVFNIPGDYNYTQQILLDAYHQGMRFAHVPVTFRRRTTGKSFISMKYPLKVIPQLILVVISIKPMKIFLPVGLFFLIGATGIFSVELVLWFLGKTIKPVLHVNAVLGLAFFGLQTFFFGLLAELIVRTRRRQ
jgi:glycosyltransferase involved in cell wall biosynthesis